MPRKYDYDLIRDLYDRGHSYGYISGQLGCSTNVINEALREDESEDELSAVDDSGRRCGCGLRLPCHQCLVDVAHTYTRSHD